MSAAFDVLTFDCYGTLIDWRGGISDAFSRIGAAAGRSVDRDQVLDLHARFEPEVQQQEFRSYAQVLDLTATRIADALSLEIPIDDRHFLSASLANWQPFADTRAALKRLREAGYRLGILSNVDDDLLAKTLEHFPVDFDLVITAQQVGAYKPAPGHFREARRQIDGAPWLHVAQSFFHDVQPAVAMEVPVVWINRLQEDPCSEAMPLAVFPDMESFAKVAVREGGLASS
jgi:2-haloalkanoic acid dehalogenase type II